MCLITGNIKKIFGLKLNFSDMGGIASFKGSLGNILFFGLVGNTDSVHLSTKNAVID